jgi:hypothetical protein
VLESRRREDSLAGLCRKQAIVQNLHDRRPQEFSEAGKKRLGDDVLAVRRVPGRSTEFRGVVGV